MERKEEFQLIFKMEGNIVNIKLGSALLSLNGIFSEIKILFKSLAKLDL